MGAAAVGGSVAMRFMCSAFVFVCEGCAVPRMGRAEGAANACDAWIMRVRTSAQETTKPSLSRRRRSRRSGRHHRRSRRRGRCIERAHSTHTARALWGKGGLCRSSNI